MSADWIKGFFKGEDVYILGSGGSLVGYDFSQLVGKNVITINRSYQYAKGKIHVFLDPGFNTYLRLAGETIDDVHGRVVTSAYSGFSSSDKVTVVQTAREISSNPNQLYGARGSGLVALNIALIAGARRMFLLGMDGKYVGNRCHFYCEPGNHCREEVAYRRTNDAYVPYYRFDNIFNLSQDSILEFPKVNGVEEAKCA